MAALRRDGGVPTAAGENYMFDDFQRLCELDALDFLRLDPFLKTLQFGQRHVESFLSPLIGRAGITEDAGPVLEGLITRPDGVTEAPLLADLGE